jgi:predicted dehydrogenase
VTVRVALVGTNFGARFLPIWQADRRSACTVVCRRSAAALDRVGAAFGIDRRLTSYEAVLQDPDVDAVHLCTPPAAHARQAVAALHAGKHVLCSAPMATSVAELARVLGAHRSSGRVYMLAETAVHTREYAHVRSLHRTGSLGELQFGLASHIQDTRHARSHWRDVSPMLYSSHVVAPLLTLTGSSALTVSCMTSLAGQEERARGYVFQSCLVDTGPGSPVLSLLRGAGTVSRSWLEGFTVYGSRMSVEWPRVPEESPLAFGDGLARPVHVPDHGGTLPTELRRFTAATAAGPANGHGGSYAHIVDAFLRAVLDADPSPSGADAAAAWTAVGLAAQASSERRGQPASVPTVDQLCRLGGTEFPFFPDPPPRA